MKSRIHASTTLETDWLCERKVDDQSTNEAPMQMHVAQHSAAPHARPRMAQVNGKPARFTLGQEIGAAENAEGLRHGSTRAGGQRLRSSRRVVHPTTVLQLLRPAGTYSAGVFVELYTSMAPSS